MVQDEENGESGELSLLVKVEAIGAKTKAMRNASRDARGLFERSLGRQPRTWARRETQHAARDEREKDKHKKGKDAILSEQWKTRGTLARNGSHKSRERTQKMKETKENGRETSCNARPQRTGVWPRRSRIVAEGDRGPFRDQKRARTRSKQSRDTASGSTSRDERKRELNSKRAGPFGVTQNDVPDIVVGIAFVLVLVRKMWNFGGVGVSLQRSGSARMHSEPRIRDLPDDSLSIQKYTKARIHASCISDVYSQIQ
ncbi:hypothetical protein BGW80DRAFT_1442404 [Lactifluus volemus]|nr:hypothetical protein BGW80DRAFT_1442404 [Lactifluus volemus]